MLPEMRDFFMCSVGLCFLLLLCFLSSFVAFFVLVTGSGWLTGRITSLLTAYLQQLLPRELCHEYAPVRRCTALPLIIYHARRIATGLDDRSLQALQGTASLAIRQYNMPARMPVHDGAVSEFP